MNNIIEEDEQFINIEPQISYYSSSLNCGVTAICSKNDKKQNRKISKLFSPVSPKNNFSLCNTIMLPFIINKDGIESYSNNYYNNKINHSVSIIKEKDINQTSLKKDNTRNKTISSKTENKENDDNLNEKIFNQKYSINYEKNPFFLGKNFSTNINDNNKINHEDFNLRYNNEKLYESENNNSRNEGEIKYFMNRGQCKSVNINDVKVNSCIIKDETKKDKSEKYLKKVKKAKIKESFLNKKSKENKDNLKKKLIKKKSFFCREQSKSYIEESMKDNIKKIVKNGRGTNYSGGDIKTKSYYYSNKMINLNYNENYFKQINKKKIPDKLNEKDEKAHKNSIFGKTERKKKKKGNKTPLREININKKSIKLKFPIPINLKINDSAQKKQGLNILKDQIKNKDNNSANDSSRNLSKDKIKNSKSRKIKIKKIPSRKKEKDNNNNNNNNYTDSSEENNKIKTKTPNRRTSGFSFKKKLKRRSSDNDNSEPQTYKTLKLKNYKDKDNASKSQYSIKKLNNSITQKQEVDSYKNSLDEKENINKMANILRRKRSISLHLEKSKAKEVEDAIKHKKTLNNNNRNLNSLSTTNLNKIKKINKRKFDFEIALKKNSQKMQFNLFNKDKFTNTEFSDSDYLKYTLNCMELILEIDMEKQTRLKNKINFNFPKPKKKGVKKKIALFDLDETLVHCTGDIKIKKDKYQHSIEIKLPGKQAVQVGINLRPYWKQTLNLIKKNYHIVIYTASHQAYADAVLDFMDPKKKYFKYRLYRNNCSLIDVDGAKFYVKDLEILNEYYDLKDIVIVDNSVLSFAFHLHNGIPIVPYYDEDKDGSLYVVGLYLIHIFPENDLREANKTQINLDSFLEEAKKQKEENDNIIDEESDDEEEEKSQKINNKINDINKEKEDPEIRNTTKEDTKITGKKIIGKTSFMPFNQLCPRRQSHDFTEKKLISQSKLINMYYEVNDDSTKTLQQKINESNEGKKTDENILVNLNLSNKENEKNEIDKATYMVTEDGIEIDCKSDLGYQLFEQNNNNISDNDSNSDEEIAVLKRGFTIIEDDHRNNNKKNAIKGKLKFIRSNFYNKFKI